MIDGSSRYRLSRKLYGDARSALMHRCMDGNNASYSDTVHFRKMCISCLILMTILRASLDLLNLKYSCHVQSKILFFLLWSQREGRCTNGSGFTALLGAMAVGKLRLSDLGITSILGIPYPINEHHVKSDKPPEMYEYE